MHRLTAKLLLLFALAGSCVPLALAATATAPHACCIRKAHHCRDSASEESEHLIIRSASCCNHDCCRAVTTSQWAYPQPSIAAISVQSVTAPLAESHPDSPAAKFSSSQSTRAPPVC
jgi:hypothetical protein